jgi:hypothetical protein
MFGFFQNHWIQAKDVADAFSKAQGITKADKKWEEMPIGSRPGDLKIRLYEWEEVNSIDDVGANPSGYNFYVVPRWWEVWKRDWWITRTERDFVSREPESVPGETF